MRPVHRRYGSYVESNIRAPYELFLSIGGFEYGQRHSVLQMRAV